MNATRDGTGQFAPPLARTPRARLALATAGRSPRWTLSSALRMPLVAAAALCAGCGYTTGLQLAPGHYSIGVELFRNDTPVRDLERELHKALARSTRDMVDAPLVPPGQASVVVRGRILDYYRRGGVRSRDNELVETAVTVRVESSLWEGHSGKRLVAPVRSSVQVGYVIDGLESEREAVQRALDNLAQAIVLDLLSRPPEAPASGSEEL